LCYEQCYLPYYLSRENGTKHFHRTEQYDPLRGCAWSARATEVLQHKWHNQRCEVKEHGHTVRELLKVMYSKYLGNQCGESFGLAQYVRRLFAIADLAFRQKP
jgi:hypothetical protein